MLDVRCRKATDIRISNIQHLTSGIRSGGFVRRTEKKATVLELRGKLTRAKSAIFTNFRGLTVAEITELRNLLRKASVEYRVIKNTLAELAINGTELQGLREYLRGPTAIAFSFEDPITPTKILTTFAKNKPALQIKGGCVEGRVLGPQAIQALSELPPREVLLRGLIGKMRAPLYNLVGIMKGQLLALVRILDAIRAQKASQA
ncbi:MAG: 50S ribosomal protein L10 [Candidatus Methylomirabilales bacterium]